MPTPFVHFPRGHGYGARFVLFLVLALSGAPVFAADSPNALPLNSQLKKQLQEQQRQLELSRESQRSRPGFNVMPVTKNLESPAEAAPPAPAKQEYIKVPDNPDDPSLEVMKAHEKVQEAYKQFNNSNPLSADFNAAGGAISGTGPMAQLGKIMNQPIVQGYLRLFQNTAFQKAAEELMNHPRRMYLLYSQIGWVLFMLVFRAWRFSKARNWLGKLATNAWTFAMYSAGSTLLVPYLVLGDPYVRTLSMIWDSFFRK